MSDQRRATIALADVRLERRQLGAGHGAVEIIAQPRFDLFASPNHFRSVLLSSLSSLLFTSLRLSLLLYVYFVRHDGLTPICCKIRASSIRPRLILDFTVPSGTDKTR